MSLPKAIIAEDEPLLRDEIRRMLRDAWPALIVCSEVGDGIQAIEAMDRFQPQILFLDIQMPGCSGLEVARHASGRAHIVFITAYNAHAIDAFEAGALDYLLKPISAERFKVTVNRLQARIKDVPANLGQLAALLKAVVGGEQTYIKWLTVPHASELRVVAVSEVLYLQADNKYTTIATRSATYLLNSSLKEMLSKLDPANFWQIHRGTIVNIGAIDKIYRSFRGALEVKMRDRDELLTVSAAYSHLFKHA